MAHLWAAGLISNLVRCAIDHFRSVWDNPSWNPMSQESLPYISVWGINLCMLLRLERLTSLSLALASCLLINVFPKCDWIPSPQSSLLWWSCLVLHSRKTCLPKIECRRQASPLRASDQKPWRYEGISSPFFFWGGGELSIIVFFPSTSSSLTPTLRPRCGFLQGCCCTAGAKLDNQRERCGYIAMAQPSYPVCLAMHSRDDIVSEEAD